MRPIILNYAEQRIVDEKSLYEYDFVESMNMINNCERKIAFIDSNSSNISLETETKTAREGSDSDLNLLEFNTVTRANREQDEWSDVLLEMKTKTLTDRERDDESFDYN
jgi:hypothetical protein